VVISATKKARAYEPETGKLIWERAGLGLNVIPHPVQRNDTVRGRKVNNRLLLKSLVIELRADVGEAQRPKAQALQETSAAPPGGLIKTFDDYERSEL
jgi:hypothetical protein